MGVKRGLEMYEKKVFRKILGSRRVEVGRQFRISLNEEHYVEALS
jgi:hypothetical protein